MINKKSKKILYKKSKKKSQRAGTKYKNKSKKGGRKSKKKSKKKSQRAGTKFKKGEIVNLLVNGKKQNMEYVKTNQNNKITLKYLNKKETINVDINKIEKKSKRIVNTKKRQKERRKKLVRKKRGIRTKSTTLELPDSNDSDVDDLMENMKI